MNKKPFFVTIPHSGERVPEFCTWLKTLPETILMYDVDRFVDRLYEPALKAQEIPYIKTEWHRYAADLNRIPDDVDSTSVVGNTTAAGTHNRGFHWVVTTDNYQLMKEPMPKAMHDELTKLIYDPFHAQVRNQYEKFHNQKEDVIYHIDAHSMPSRGTKMHRDPGELRADIVVSDCKGKSSKKEFVDLVIEAYTKAGFKIAYNWPYFGGRVSEQYGEPQKGHHCVQVEMNRALYMDEATKQIKNKESEQIQKQVDQALKYILQNL